MPETDVEVRFTLDDLLALPEDGRRHELLWGALVMTPVPSARHAYLVDDLAAVLRSVCPSGLRVTTNSGVLVPDRPVTNAPAADLFVAARGASAEPYVSAADVALVVEVSLTTYELDRTTKAASYAAGGIDWYWIVRADRSIEVMRRDGDGYRTVLVATPGEESELPGPFPVRLDPGTLAQD